MEPTERSNTDWADCQAGEVQRLVQGLQAARRARTIEHRAAIAAALLLVGFTGAWFAGVLSQSEPNYGGIVCSEVMKNGREFMSQMLDENIADQINIHLGQCEACRKQFEKMKLKTPLDNDPETQNKATRSAEHSVANHSELPSKTSLAGL